MEKPEIIESGELARLIPVIADTSKEQRITSVLLATFMSVDEYVRELFNTIGVRVGKTSKIRCYTEVVLKNREDKKIRPDGLVEIITGKNSWTALVEAKIGKAELNQDQVETYLDLAKMNKIDAVITISNQFAANASHHPLTVAKIKTRHVNLYHWSWSYLLTEAMMWAKHHGLSDPDQAFILEEVVRYFRHDSSGLISFERMGTEWKEVCSSVQNRVKLHKSTEQVTQTVSGWHQYLRKLSLDFSLAIGTSVTVWLKKAHRDDPAKRLNDDSADLAERSKLSGVFEVPDAASKIEFIADLETKTVTAKMRLKAPEGRATAKGRINWLIKQLSNCEDQTICVRASWPSRASDTLAELYKIQQGGSDILMHENRSLIPVAFEVSKSLDLAGRFRGSQTFIQDSQSLLLDFYENVGQHLREWVSPPPQMKKNIVKTPEELEKLNKSDSANDDDQEYKTTA